MRKGDRKQVGKAKETTTVLSNKNSASFVARLQVGRAAEEEDFRKHEVLFLSLFQNSSRGN